MTLRLAACLKWVDRRADVDPLTGALSTDPRTSGASPADEAALELALRLADDWGAEVLAATAAGPQAEPMLRDALAAGATAAVRVDLAPGASSAAVAAGLAGVLAGCDVVLCGAWSLDRGSGSVPAFLAAHLGAAQALGCLSVDAESPGVLLAERRLDGGRRERLRVTATVAVVSVEAGVARLRRAGLSALRAAATAPIDVVALADPNPGPPARVGPYRPRARVLTAPAGDTARERVLHLTGANRQQAAARVITAEPDEAATAIIDQLVAWGYLAP